MAMTAWEVNDMGARPACYGQHHDDDRCADCASPWRQYVFFPADLTYWSAGCLRDVQERISRLMAERRERR